MRKAGNKTKTTGTCTLTAVETLSPTGPYSKATRTAGVPGWRKRLKIRRRRRAIPTLVNAIYKKKKTESASGVPIAMVTGYVSTVNARASQTAVKRILIHPSGKIVIMLRTRKDPAFGIWIAKVTGLVSTANARASQTAEQTTQLIFASLNNKSDDWQERAGCSRTKRAPAYQVNQDLLYRQTTTRSLITQRSRFMAAH